MLALCKAHQRWAHNTHMPVLKEVLVIASIPSVQFGSEEIAFITHFHSEG